jgi:hypothetical protein
MTFIFKEPGENKPKIGEQALFLFFLKKIPPLQAPAPTEGQRVRQRHPDGKPCVGATMHARQSVAMPGRALPAPGSTLRNMAAYWASK